MTATIPNVKGQLQKWATSKPAEPSRETFAARDLTVLGAVGRSQFATTRDGRELRLRGPAMPHDIERAPADAVVVSRQARDKEGRIRTEHFVGRVVPPGTFASTSKRSRYVPKARPVTAVDRDADLRQQHERQFVPLGPDDGSPEAVVKGALSRRPAALVTDGRPGFGTVADEIRWLTSKGVQLDVSDDGAHLLVTCAKPLPGDAASMLERRTDLYRAYLAGDPLPCAWPHTGASPDAVSIATGNAPVCADHLASSATADAG